MSIVFCAIILTAPLASVQAAGTPMITGLFPTEDPSRLILSYTNQAGKNFDKQYILDLYSNQINERLAVDVPFTPQSQNFTAKSLETNFVVTAQDTVFTINNNSKSLITYSFNSSYSNLQNDMAFAMEISNVLYVYAIINYEFSNGTVTTDHTDCFIFDTTSDFVKIVTQQEFFDQTDLTLPLSDAIIYPNMQLIYFPINPASGNKIAVYFKVKDYTSTQLVEATKGYFLDGRITKIFEYSGNVVHVTDVTFSNSTDITLDLKDIGVFTGNNPQYALSLIGYAILIVAVVVGVYYNKKRQTI